MSIALSEFWTRLVHNGIADAERCKQFADAYCAANNGTPATDAASLAQFLKKTKAITSFQVTALLSQPPGQIRLGGFVQTSDQPSMPLGHWLPVKTILGQDEQFFPGWSGRSGFLLRVPAAQATDFLNQWLGAHAAANGDSLQAIELYGSDGGDREVFSPLPSGRSLADLTTKKMKVSRRQALGISISIANALTAMHERSLVHGEVRADRIWMTSGGSGVLLRDPSGPPRVPRADPSLCWIHASESAGDYAAPEFVDPNQACTIATDIYSLGCLMFRMFVGRLPMASANQLVAGSGSDMELHIASHLSFVPPELTEAIEQGESGDPILRVIAYAMAKNPASRFASAQQVVDALTAVQASLSSAASSATPAKSKPKVPSKPTAKDETASAAKAGSSASSKSASENVSSETLPKKTRSPREPKESPPANPVEPTSSQPAAKKATSKKFSGKKSSSKNQPVAKTKASDTPAAKQPAESPVAAPPASDAITEQPPLASKQPLASEKVVAPPVQPPPPPASSEPAPIDPPPMVVDSDMAENVRQNPAEIVTAVASSPVASQPSDPLRSEPLTTESQKSESPVRRRRRKKKNNLPFILGMLSIPLLATFVMLVVQATSGSSAPEKKSRPPIPVVVPPVASSIRNVETPSTTTKTASPDKVRGYQIVSDGNFPWVTPYPAGTKPVSLSLLPPGPAAVVTVQLNQLLSDTSGRDLVSALSPELTGLINQAVQRTRLPLTDIKRLSVALHAYRDGWPEASLAIELMQPKPLKNLADLWQVSDARTSDGSTIYAGDEPNADAYYLGDSQKGSLAPDAMVTRFAVGTIAKIKLVAENEGGEIPLPRAMQKLWDSSSADAHLVALITPNFLFADGREMLNTAAPQLVSPLKKTLITDYAGLLLSATANENVFYAEVKAVPSGGISSAALMRKLDATFQTWPAWADSFSIDAVPDRSWRLLANRLPQMMRFLVEHTRFGVEDDVVIANSYLPSSAASQISVATLLAMNTEPGQAAVAQATTAKPLSVDEMLDRKMSIAFDQLSLEFAIDAVAEEFSASLPQGTAMPSVRIIGSDLQKMGITQNQQIRDFKRQDTPLRTVLTELVLGANPDKTATGPGDPKQSLVWVIHEESGEAVILVTTRNASVDKYKLPKEFQLDES